MTYRYAAAAKVGTRQTVRILPATVRRGEIRRKALTPTAYGHYRLEYPTAFLTEHPAGCWESIAAPRLVDKVSIVTRQTILGMQT